MDTNELIRSTIIWDLEDSLKKKDAEIERLQKQAHYHYENGLKKDVEIELLREALQHMVRWHDQLSASDIAKANAALQQNGSE